MKVIHQKKKKKEKESRGQFSWNSIRSPPSNICDVYIFFNNC